MGGRYINSLSDVTNSPMNQEYIFHMRKIDKRGNLTELEIIRYIIDSIQDYETNKDILYGATNFAEFKDKIVYYETIRSKVDKGGRKDDEQQ